MKKTLLITAVLSALCVGVASAQFPGLSVGQPPGLNLSWSQCDAGLGSTGQNMKPTCLSNTAFAPAIAGQAATGRTMYASFIYPAGMTSLGATDMLIDIATGPGGTLNCWWNYLLTNPSRSTAISMGFVPDLDGNCGDYWATLPNAIGVFGFARLVPHPTLGPSASRIDLTAAANADEGVAAAQPAVGDEILDFTLKVTPANSITTGNPGNHGQVGVCPGCLLPACIRFQQCIMYRKDGPPITLNSASSRQFVQWQLPNVNAGTDPVAASFAIFPTPAHVGVICDQPVPTRNKTWGTLKSLYR